MAGRSRRELSNTSRDPAHAAVRRQVQLPAVALFITAGFWASALLVTVVFDVWQLTSAAEPGVDGGQLTPGPALIVRTCWSLVMLIISGLIATGALRMYQLRNRRWAWCAAILAVVPFVAPCFIGSLPLGIWAIIVLRRPDVAAAFE